MKKNFDDWNKLKIKLDTEHHAPTFQEREIWWCSVGVNIGNESDGKNKDYNRPVLVLRKFNKRIFWGLPLTTRIKSSPHYHQIKLHGKKQCVMLTQLRLFDSKRITDKMGQLPINEFNQVQEAVVNSVLKQKKPL